MRTRSLVASGVALIAIGVAFALMSKEWIEDTLGFEPDGGNGMVELAIAVVPIVIGVGLLTYAAVQRGGVRRHRLGAATDDGGRHP